VTRTNAVEVSRPPGVPADWPFPDVTLVRLFEDAFRDVPNQLAVVTRRHARTYAQLAEVAGRVTSALVALEVMPGDAVVVASGDHVDTLAAHWAVWACGAVVVLPDAHDDPLTLARCVDAVAIVVADGDTRADPEGAGPLELDDARSSPAWVTLPAPVRGPRVRRARAADTAAGQGAPIAGRHPHATAVTPDDAAVIVMRDVPIVVTHEQLVASAFQVRLWVPDVRAGHERVVVDHPWADPAALATGPLFSVLAAATLVLAEGDVARSVDSRLATLAVLAPASLVALAGRRRRPHRDITSLRVVLVTGALPVAAARAIAAETVGARVRALHCLAGPLPTHAHPVYGRVDPDGVGLPLTGTTSTLDPEDAPAGRLVVAGPQVGEEAVVTDLIAHIAPDGSVTVVGTEDERIVGADPIITRREVERVLESHAGVESASVVDEHGTLVARVRGPRRRRPSEDELRALCHARLGQDGTPARVEYAARLAHRDGDGGRA